jgi:hypothetical protein
MSWVARCGSERRGVVCYYSQKHMPQTVEISLRIPSLRVRREDTDALETINNSDVRFCKHIEVDSIPKPGVVLTMATSANEKFECEVVRSDWHHDKNMFVIACRYSKRSVSPAEYHALMNSSDWQVRALI